MKEFIGGVPPGPHAGDISSQTEALRPAIQLSVAQCQTARRLRRNGWEILDIAARIGAKDEEVRLALAAMRTQRPKPTRATLNVTIAARDFVLSETQDGEACWETLDRLLAELAFRRAMDGVPVTTG